MHADDMLRYGHQTLMKSLERIHDDIADVKDACGYWSVKDLIIHLTASELLLIDACKFLQGDTNTPYLNASLNNQSSSYNDDIVAAEQSKTYQEILEFYQETHKTASELVAQIDDDLRKTTGALTWYGEDYDLEDFLVYTVYAHKREHSAHIDAFADRMG